MDDIETVQKRPENVVIRLQRQIDRLEMEKVRLQKRITELEGTVAEYDLQLRQQGGRIDTDMKWQLHNHIGMTPSELTLLFLLLTRREGLTKGAIMEALYSHDHSADEVPEIKIVDVFICKLRKRLREKAGLHPGTIQTIWGKGYKIASEHRPALLRHLGIDES